LREIRLSCPSVVREPRGGEATKEAIELGEFLIAKVSLQD